jgi:dTDP-4-amino-4,6-dideoxygalactose transaminase
MRTDHPPGFRWLHESFGTNWRMTEVQATIGRLQLKKLEAWVTRRRAPAHVRHACYKFYAFLDLARLKSGWSRERIVSEVVARGIPCFTGSCSEVYLEKAFDGTDLRPRERLPVARELGETSLMFLVHPTLDDGHMERTAEVVRAVMAEATI